jgi:transposase
MPRERKYRVNLSDEQVKELKKLMHSKTASLTIKSRCQILLDMDEAHGKQYLEAQCAKRNAVHIATVSYTIKKYVEEGFDGAITLKRNVNSDNARRKVDGRAEAQLVALACGPVPEGHSRWTLRLLEEKAKVFLEYPVSHDTIRRTLKKTNCDLTESTTGVSHPKKMPNL